MKHEHSCKFLYVKTAEFLLNRMWHDQIIAGFLNSKALYEYLTNGMSCKQTRDWIQEHTKMSNVLTKIELRGHPDHYQQHGAKGFS